MAVLEMSHRRVKPSRLSILLMLLAALAFAKWYQVSDHSPLPIVSTPTDIAALRALQARVQAAARKVLPAIVAVRNAEPLVDDKPHIYKQYCSGVIITADGLVLSQFHVSHRYIWNGKEPVRSRQPGERTTVIVSDGREVKAELLGADQTYDLSLVRLLEPGPYPYVPLEPETAVRLGDWVLKLGHPIGYRRDRPPVVRLGRVLFQESESFVTDCNIAGGDSGGPLIDLDGRFVGMIGDSGIPPKLKTKTAPAPEKKWLFNCTTSSVVRRCLPSMLGREISPPDTTFPEKRNKRLESAKDTLPLGQWTQGETTALAFRALVEPATRDVVEIRDATNRQTAVGTIVEPDGWILTVASLLPAKPRCLLPDQQVVSAKVVGVNPAFDLALLKVSASNLCPVPWAKNGPVKMAGTILACAAHPRRRTGPSWGWEL